MVVIQNKATRKYVSGMWYDVLARGYRFKTVKDIAEADKWKKEDVPQMSGGFWVNYRKLDLGE